ncbi:hypothetical protein EMIHUDRAFT_441325 [Emiliania huxleyi CCMP1516]|uniref:Uncharacterized protein n=2 Tax=Emiliania huxleyi TaxID=2903 RepID=A0A0D3KED3_EMIH1|nr:hypothetical protein EMIHUDRAFT_441325 [Emiliania huxleyi CCMP1516]EOD34118.1 hypothetical protein EMIHUDRAFT_441325 [Emiliania huxleyi CCMP1516]|eukprot:XP_005786547.1 hypothetical protein EMIHUDRAFT_441325 [Emiliania huxleyi CCMP1516]
MASMGAGASSGNIALRNCVQKSLVFTPELGKTALRVKSLHRDCLRSVAWTKRAYTVPLPEREMRALVSLAFREKSSISDMHQANPPTAEIIRDRREGHARPPSPARESRTSCSCSRRWLRRGIRSPSRHRPSSTHSSTESSASRRLRCSSAAQPV